MAIYYGLTDKKSKDKLLLDTKNGQLEIYETENEAKKALKTCRYRELVVIKLNITRIKE
jgi:hypothetical protein